MPACNLLFRADGNTQIGQGHLTRCLALAQAVTARGCHASFLTARSNASLLVNQIESQGIAVWHLTAEPGSAQDAKETIECANREGSTWLVVDGYSFDCSYQGALKQAGLHVLFIDDHGNADRYTADLVLNQNLHATESMYPLRDAKTRLLLGAGYALLRQEFWQWRGWQRKIEDVGRKILITMGGSDPQNVSLTALRAVQELNLPEIEVRVMVGSGNLNQRSLEEQSLKGGTVKVERTPKVAEVMMWADLAISAAGSTCWETCFLGLPTVVMALADNQIPIAAALHAQGISVNAGKSQESIRERVRGLMSDRPQRKMMSERGKALIDGQGAFRVTDVLLGGGACA